MNTHLKAVSTADTVIFKGRLWDVAGIVPIENDYVHMRHDPLTQKFYAVIFADDGSETQTELTEIKE